MAEVLEKEGKVIAKGPKCAEMELGLHVLYQKGYGLFFNMGGKKFHAIKESEILGILTNV